MTSTTRISATPTGCPTSPIVSGPSSWCAGRAQRSLLRFGSHSFLVRPRYFPGTQARDAARGPAPRTERWVWMLQPCELRPRPGATILHSQDAHPENALSPPRSPQRRIHLPGAHNSAAYKLHPYALAPAGANTARLVSPCIPLPLGTAPCAACSPPLPCDPSLRDGSGRSSDACIMYRIAHCAPAPSQPRHGGEPPHFSDVASIPEPDTLCVSPTRTHANPGGAHPDWVGWLNAQSPTMTTPISQLAVPWADCQGESITDQLRHGVRAAGAVKNRATRFKSWGNTPFTFAAFEPQESAAGFPVPRRPSPF